MCTQTEKQQMGWCGACSMACQKIGENNRIGVKKSYCCRCYFKIDPSFTPDLWCPRCQTMNPDVAFCGRCKIVFFTQEMRRDGEYGYLCVPCQTEIGI